MGIKLSEVFVDAKDMLSSILSETNTITLSKYGIEFAELGKLKHFHIAPKEQGFEDSECTLNMTLTYDMLIKKEDAFITTEMTNDLALLNTKGDFDWNRSLKYKIWEGNYPSTVCIDKNSGGVYLLYLYKNNVVELQYFATLSKDELELFLEDIDETNPYKIRIDNEAMFSYIAGDEGLNHLKRNIVIELNCGIPLVIKNSIIVD